MTRRTAIRSARSSTVTVAQSGGGEAGPSGPSRRTTACRWTTPRAWNSATLANTIRTRDAAISRGRPAEVASARRDCWTNRAHNRPAWALNSTWPV
jgi:hypothetical protein